jgi:BirA family biotin operon repressor/biotin-[acetyl-CoA-carboxylase] ligase
MVTAMRGDRATRALRGTRFADVRWVDETGSTNRDLLELAAAGAPEGVVLVADHQTAGRGRLDRTWQAPSGGSLLVSVLLRPPLPVSDAHLLTTAVGVSAVAACREVTGVDPGLKWPNDLVLPGADDRSRTGADRKLGGILAESVIEGGTLSAVVVGLGLNVNWSPDLPEDLAAIAVALNQVVGHEVDREDLLVALLQGLDRRYREILDDFEVADSALDGRRALMAEARTLSATLSRRVRADLGVEQVEGMAVALTDEGALVVETDRGDRRTVIAGDVVHLRPV